MIQLQSYFIFGHVTEAMWDDFAIVAAQDIVTVYDRWFALMGDAVSMEDAQYFLLF